MKNSIKLIIGFLIIVIIVGMIVSLFIKKDYIDDKKSVEEVFPAIRVYIYNGCGFQGVANRINEYLLNANIDVVNTRNAQKFVYDETVIVVKHNDENDLRRLKDMTGINNVIYAVNKNFEVPFIIIAGKDYEKFFNVNKK
ncbi:MAG: LytR C-terminal domain-containing protein [Candidatus Cloacimonetes bacterium]|jgi:hypothetical protein|nr:LytR C-terminal domain-containing protein [Candidatus Cloacimonadota bacterium]